MEFFGLTRERVDQFFVKIWGKKETDKKRKKLMIKERNIEASVFPR